jgi:hypothetical protein
MKNELNKKVYIAKKIYELQQHGKSKCKHCKGQHGLNITVPTRYGLWRKDAIDLGVEFTVPCHICHPKYFREWMVELSKERPDCFINPKAKEPYSGRTF